MKVADNERKNVEFPACTLSYSLNPRHLRNAFTFQKIDPTKEGWGDITIELNVKGPQTMTRQIPAPIQTNLGGNAAWTTTAAADPDDDEDLYAAPE